MYRRNISHILYPVACLIGLFIIYQAWFKPTYLPTPPPGQPNPVVEDSRDAPPESHQDGPPELEPKQTRLIDPSVVPETTHHKLLETIRDEIEKGNVKIAETKLVDLPAAVAEDNTTRPYVSVLWNNLGIQQEKHGGTAVSINAFKKAASLDAMNPVVQLNLAHAYWELRDPAMTQDFLEKLVVLAPNEPFPHLALANLFQERDQLGEAARHLDQATARADKDPAVQSYLRTVTAKVRGTEKSEARLTSRDSAHFTVKFDGEADQATWAVVLEILEEAYREIGQKFGHFPSKTIVVVLHAKSTFQSATGSPVWADGLFDPVLVRIQVPAQDALADRAWLTRVLRHEFVHALLHDQLGPAGSVHFNHLKQWVQGHGCANPFKEEVVLGLLASRVLAPVHREIGIFIGKDHGRSVFVPFSDDVPDDGACEHLLQIDLLAQSGQKGERIEESFQSLEFKILIHLVERLPDLRRLHEPPKRFLLGRKRIHEAKDEAQGAACYAKRHAHTQGHDQREELDCPPEIMEN